jgi:signal transduction histidine kinase
MNSELQSIVDEPVPSYRVTVEGQPRPIPPQVRDEVYRIAREAFRNAAAHAYAENIETDIAFSDADLFLRIRDDGRGMDQHILEQGRRIGHWGLQGMRERAKTLDGQLTVWSKPGAGTEVELRVPAHIAFGPDDVA